jgi:hypothetical protein
MFGTDLQGYLRTHARMMCRQRGKQEFWNAYAQARANCGDKVATISVSRGVTVLNPKPAAECTALELALTSLIMDERARLHVEGTKPMIKLVADGMDRLGPRGQEILRAEVRKRLEQGGAVRSSSGRALVFAVEWCEEKGVPYALQGTPGTGYILEPRTEL